MVISRLIKYANDSPILFFIIVEDRMKKPKVKSQQYILLENLKKASSLLIKIGKKDAIKRMAKEIDFCLVS